MKKSALIGTVALSALILTTNVALAQPGISQASFEQAIPRIRTKCIDGLCLGATVAEVQKLGTLTWKGSAVPDGKLTCDDAASQAATGTLTDRDGAKYQINFDIVKTQGTALSRYRLVSIAVRLTDASSKGGELVVSRWAQDLGFPASNDRSTRMLSIADQFDLIIDQSKLALSNDALIVLSSAYQHKQQWLQTFSQCQGSRT